MRFGAIAGLKRKTRSRRAGPRNSRRAQPKVPPKTQLVRGGLSLLSRPDTDEAAVTALVFELHKAGNHGEERVILAPADVFPGLMLGAALAHQNGARVDQLPAEALDAQPLAV